MFISSRIIGSVFLGLILVAGTVGAATSTIQGDVKGPDGKPIQGAQVTIARKDAKGSVGSVKTDSKGRYVLKDLALGAYNISVNANGMAATTATDVKSRTDGVLRLDFNLKRQAGTAEAATPDKKKKVKRMVWVPGKTGSNLGGGWAEVEEGDNTSQASRTQTHSAESVRRIQSNSGAVRGSN
jgi:hypothetical protein